MRDDQRTEAGAAPSKPQCKSVTDCGSPAEGEATDAALWAAAQKAAAATGAIGKAVLWLKYAAGSVSHAGFIGKIMMLIMFVRFATGAFFNISAAPVLPDLAEGAQLAIRPPLGDAKLTVCCQDARCK